MCITNRKQLSGRQKPKYGFKLFFYRSHSDILETLHTGCIVQTTSGKLLGVSTPTHHFKLNQWHTAKKPNRHKLADHDDLQYYGFHFYPLRIELMHIAYSPLAYGGYGIHLGLVEVGGQVLVGLQYSPPADKVPLAALAAKRIRVLAHMPYGDTAGKDTDQVLRELGHL